MAKIFITNSDTPYTTNIVSSITEYIYIAEGITRAAEGANHNGLSASGGGSVIDVLGTLVGADSFGLKIFHTAGDNGNYQITVGASGSIIGVDAISLVDANNRLTNLGQILGSHVGISNVGDDFQLTNNGVISSEGNEAVLSSGSDTNFVNYGLIQSLAAGGYAAVSFFTSNSSANASLTNYGTISANSGVAVLGGLNDVDNVYNFGTLNGGVYQFGGNDLFRNDGQVNGDVDLGAGADKFKGWGGTVEGTIHGGVGNDTIAGGISDDAIFGDGGADILKGDQGDDTLTGGPGHDLMRGGAGLDTFDFNKISDSAAGTQRDHILDFSKADDVIDLSTIDAKTGIAGNQAFHFIAGAFTGHKGELHSVNAGANSRVEGDVTGDGNADFSILIVDVHNLHAGDFIL